MALLLFRELSPHQQREKIIRMQALVDANRIASRQLKGPLRAVSNETVRAHFKDAPIPRKNGDGRDPSAPMDDYLEP